MEIDPDIIEMIKKDWPKDKHDEIIEKLKSTGKGQRILRCIVFASRGHDWHFDYLCKLAGIDYRDVIMVAEYTRSNERIYDFNKPFEKAKIEHPYNNDKQGIL